MRTLKKTLSLVLVVAMVLGLCVVGASAYNKVEDFTDDVSKIGDAYYEAVGVLTGIGVIDGMTETAFEPQGNYTREQAAKIIAYMQLGKDKADSLKCTVAPFDDVAATRWSAGYIAYCVEQGIIDGMTETTFEPTGKLTGFQWAKMLLCAVGFGVNDEFTGSSWSVNTAKVAHTVNLFAGDLAGADHTALTREQAALYAFNVLTNVKKVAYSANVTSYVYGIRGYWTVDGIGSTLGEDVYDLHNVVGIIVDNEGMGASATKVSSNYTTTKTVSIKAGTGLDMMYHAARVWYVGTNTGVFTYDLAKTTPYECMNIAAGTKAAATAKATTGLTLGDTSKTAYEAYLIDNSAINAGSAYVTLYADFGALGYVDKANKTTSIVNGATFASADVMTDISAIDYMDPIVYIHATSKTESKAEAAYIYAATATSGVVKSIAQENGVVVSVTLTDGTVLPISSLYAKYHNAGAIETYVIGNVYAFVLDTHGDIIYATKDTVRDLWVYTGDWRFTNEYNGWSSERVVAANFANATTGEIKEFAVRSFKSDYYATIGVDDFSEYDDVIERGTYYDLSATATESGIYVATQVTADDTADEAYAAKYVIGDVNFVRSGNYWVDDWDYNDMGMYFDPNAVVFKVGVGYGSTFEVKTCTGIAGLKETFGVAANGMLRLENAAFTVTSTESGDYRVDTVFVMIEDVETTSNYVFVPSDISYGSWSTVTGDQGKYFVSYKGAYLEGAAIDIVFHSDLLTGDKIVRGFYTVVKFYDAYGKEYMMLDQKVDNDSSELCYYGEPTMRSTGTGIWEFYGPNFTWWNADSTTKIVDLTGHEITTLSELNRYVVTYDAEVAYTVDPNTEMVDYIYVVSAGWDAKYTVALDPSLTAAGWTIKSATSLTDTAAWDAVGETWTVTLYNARLAEASTTFPYQADIYLDGDETAVATNVNTSNLTKGELTVTITNLAAFSDTVKDHAYVIGGLDSNAEISFGVVAGKNYEVSAKPLTGSFDAGEYVFGTPVTVTVELQFASVGNDVVMEFINGYKIPCADITAQCNTVATNQYQKVTFTTYLLADGTYTLTNDDWAAPTAG